MLAPAADRQAFGHLGAGGSLAFANPVARMGFGYVTTRMKFDPSGDERTRQLVKAVYDSLH